MITNKTLEGAGPSYTLYVDGITEEANVSVSVSKAGYTITPASRPVSVHFGNGPVSEVVFSGLTAEGAGPATELRLAFGGAGIAGLTANDIYLNAGGTGAVKGELTGNGTSYTLYVSGITASGDVSVTVAKAGYAFKPPSKTATVLDGNGPVPQNPAGGGVSVGFNQAGSDGGDGYPTTALTLHFSAGIAGLAAGDITLVPVGEANKAITKGTLEGAGPSYTLGVGNVAVEGHVDVSVNKAGYSVSGNPKRAAVHPGELVSPGGPVPVPEEVVFSGLEADGTAHIAETKTLTLAFDGTGVSGLGLGDIYLNAGGTGAQAVSLTAVSNTSYKLTVSGITAEGEVGVSVNKAGYAFKPASRTAAVHQTGVPVDMAVKQTGGSSVAGASATTTGLELTFTPNIAGLAKEDITLQYAENSGIAITSLSGNGPYALAVSSIAKTGYITVSVKKSGYSIPSQSGVPVYYAEAVTFAGVQADGQADTAPTTQLTLKFSGDIAGLSAADITLSKYNSSKGTLVRTGTGTYTLPVSGISAAETLTVTAGGKSGYIISPASQQAAVHIGKATLSVTANGSSTETTTQLTLTFDKSIAGLAAGDITVSGCGAVRGALSGSGPSYTLAVSGITAAGNVTVTVSKSGYAISGSPKSVPVSYIVPVTLDSVTANGSQNATTTQLELKFSQSITGLAAGDIKVDGTGVTKGTTLGASGSVYTLPVTVTASGTVSVSVVKSGYIVSGSPKTGVQVRYAVPVTLNSVTADGSTSATTTALTLTFSQSITGLAAGDITVTPNGTGAQRGNLTTMTAEGGVYTLGLSNITASGTVSVSVVKSGYAVSGSPKDVPVHPGDMASSIKKKLNVTATGTAGVTATFNALSEYVKTAEFSSESNKIKLGDWIDLEGGLSIGSSSQTYPATDGKLRLIVVGINSFNGKNGNNTNHVVFHFKDIPVTHQMESGSISGGYRDSAMRAFVLGDFLTGLKNAGVPEGVLWKPNRALFVQTTSNAVTVADLLWLPTEWEMFGGKTYSGASEREGNQARLEYYTSPELRIKNGSDRYYLASLATVAKSFCNVNSVGNAGYLNASVVRGCAPAFCVR